MWWIIFAILSYFLAALAAMIDQYLLQGKKIPNPKLYTFFASIIGFAAILLVPFVISYPGPFGMMLNFLVGMVMVAGLLSFYHGIFSHEASAFIPAFGGLLPIFTFILNFLLRGMESVSLNMALAFLLLVFGTLIISFEKIGVLNRDIIKKAALTAFFFSLYFIFSKLAFEVQPFWSGFVWMRLTTAVMALPLLILQDVRGEIFNARLSIQTLNKRVAGIFLGNQIIALGMVSMQNFAIAIVPPVFLAFIAVLQGTEYIFVLILSLTLCYWFPAAFPARPSRRNLARKLLAIFFIAAGLVLLSFS